MYCNQNITEDIIYIGASDRRLALFENIYPIPRGISYNSYLILDEKNVLMDTCDSSVQAVFLENLKHGLSGRTLDYLIIHHMEPDHSATILEVIRLYPNVKVICNAQMVPLLTQFFGQEIASHLQVIEEHQVLKTGHHSFEFYMAPMVHWPEVMVSFDIFSHTLFTADAFGSFGALDGNIFADEVDFKNQWLPDARRYYANIVGKYGNSVQSILKKLQGLDIRMICPLHGPIWRKDLNWIIEKYQRWSTYTPEEKAVCLFCASIYGHTQQLVNVLANELAIRDVQNIHIYDLSTTHPSVVVSECFRASTLIFAASTYNADVFVPMETVLLDLKAHNLQNRDVALLQNGSWAPVACVKMRNILSTLKDIRYICDTFTIRSVFNEEQLVELQQLAEKIAQAVR